MSVISADYAANRYGTKNNIVKKSNAAKTSTVAGTKKQESVVDEFKKKHPKDARKSIFQNLTNLRRLKQAIQHYFRHRSF